MGPLRQWKSKYGFLLAEIHLTSCAVSQPGSLRFCALINPANNHLVGTELPYFPRG